MEAARGRGPETRHLAAQFDYEHLPAPLAAVSKDCHDLAAAMIERAPDNPELTFGLRQLLLAKDAFVRSQVAVERARVGSTL